jgi:hypothetical protein
MEHMQVNEVIMMEESLTLLTTTIAGLELSEGGRAMVKPLLLTVYLTPSLICRLKDWQIRVTASTQL